MRCHRRATGHALERAACSSSPISGNFAAIRQAIFIALGLALGVGLVITVTAASAGVQNAQTGVLKGLYGVGTDITVTGKPTPTAPPAVRRGPPLGPARRPGRAARVQDLPNGK